MNKLIRTTLLLLLLLLPSSVGLTSCSHDDEPDWDYYFHDLDECPAKGVYEGVVLEGNDGFGTWCELVKAPDDADGDTSPMPRCDIYFRLSDWAKTNLEIGSTIRFRILRFGACPTGILPYYNWDRLYFICIVKPED